MAITAAILNYPRFLKRRNYEEVSRLKLAAPDLRRSQVFIHQGKGAKDRVAYLSDGAYVIHFGTKKIKMPRRSRAFHV